MYAREPLTEEGPAVERTSAARAARGFALAPTVSSGGTLGPSAILGLQRTAGNAAVAAVLQRCGSGACTCGGVCRASEVPFEAEGVGHLLLAGRAQVRSIQRHPDPPDPLTAPLTDAEWGGIYIWLSRGEVGIDPLTADADHNADLVASAIFCERLLFSPHFGEGDPLLCLDNDVTAQDPRVQALKREVTARGPIIHWPAVSTENRLVYVMNLLVDTYHYPVNGAAGIVGNLYAESGVLPSRIEGSAAATPMRAANFAGQITDFTPEEVMNRSGTANPKVGPRKPGIGLAQWTSPARRSGLFGGDSSILFSMDRQVAYLVGELQANAGLNGNLTAPGVTVNDASDDVVYRFEIPGSILDASGNKLPRADPAVQAVFAARRALAQRALAAYQAAHPAPAAAPAQH